MQHFSRLAISTHRAFIYKLLLNNNNKNKNNKNPSPPLYQNFDYAIFCIFSLYFFSVTITCITSFNTLHKGHVSLMRSMFIVFLYFQYQIFIWLKDIDGEVAQHLKRLGRKDPTTKVMLHLNCNSSYKVGWGGGRRVWGVVRILNSDERLNWAGGNSLVEKERKKGEALLLWGVGGLGLVVQSTGCSVPWLLFLKFAQFPCLGPYVALVIYIM